MSQGDSETIIRNFLTEWANDGWMESFSRYIHPDCVWRNSGFPDVVGKEAVMTLLTGMLEKFGIKGANVEVIALVANGDRAMVERIDHMVDPREGEHSTPTMGSFRLKDGLIVYYADYFDPTRYLHGVADATSQLS
ncbi:limonene-1,2-epoxide hydrolase [Sphingobium faniae]|nr:limonene-1,2-epoxide hydrolase [Sphingobium faniae]